MRREKEHLVTSGMIEGKHWRGNQQGMMFDGLTKWLKIVGRVTEALKVMRDRDA